MNTQEFAKSLITDFSGINESVSGAFEVIQQDEKCFLIQLNSGFVTHEEASEVCNKLNKLLYKIATEVIS